jgi:hypothetical protein
MITNSSLDQHHTNTTRIYATTNSPAEVAEAPEAHTPGWRPHRASVVEGSTELVIFAPVN